MPIRSVLRRAALLAPLMLALADGPLAPEAGTADTLTLRARPVVLDATRTHAARVGRLEFRGGLSLSSGHPDFGGVSALIVSPDGDRLLAVTDRGQWFSAEPRYDAAGRLVGLEEAQLAPIRDRRGAPLPARAADAESLALLSDGTLLVSFERVHRVLAYRPGLRTLPDAARLGSLGSAARYSFPRRKVGKSNEGLEAVAETADGLVLAIAEGSEEDGPSPAFLFDLAGTSHTLGYARNGGFRPTAAHRLGDGSILVLERRFTWIGGVSARLRRIAADQIAPGAMLTGEKIATLVPTVTVDNMEGLAVRRAANGETLIYMISDDNFNVLQRTLLLMFALVE